MPANAQVQPRPRRRRGRRLEPVVRHLLHEWRPDRFASWFKRGLHDLCWLLVLIAQRSDGKCVFYLATPWFKYIFEVVPRWAVSQGCIVWCPVWFVPMSDCRPSPNPALFPLRSAPSVNTTPTRMAMMTGGCQQAILPYGLFTRGFHAPRYAQEGS